jgi:hypothetical protein
MSAALRNQVELLTSQLALRSASVASLGNAAESASAADWQNQISRRDALIAQLVSQSNFKRQKKNEYTKKCINLMCLLL